MNNNTPPVQTGSRFYFDNVLIWNDIPFGLGETRIRILGANDRCKENEK
jgi:hypothetical protein